MLGICTFKDKLVFSWYKQPHLKAERKKTAVIGRGNMQILSDIYLYLKTFTVSERCEGRVF